MQTKAQSEERIEEEADDDALEPVVRAGFPYRLVQGEAAFLERDEHAAQVFGLFLIIGPDDAEERALGIPEACEYRPPVSERGLPHDPQLSHRLLEFR